MNEVAGIPALTHAVQRKAGSTAAQKIDTLSRLELPTSYSSTAAQKIDTLSPENPQNEVIKRTTWIDLYPISTEERKTLGLKFDHLREEASTAGSTAGVVRLLNKLAFADEVSEKEKLAWLKIKGWIFEQVIINKDGATSILADPDAIDSEALSKRSRLRDSRGYDNWKGTQEGIYARPIFPMPISLLDYRPTKKQVADAARFEQVSPIERPGNFENFVANRLREVERLKADPVVFVDFGGVQSISTLRLATKFKNEIDQGRMVFIVTNLSASKAEVEQYIKSTGYGQEEAWVLEAMKLVHYIQADAEELQKLSVSLPTGQSIKINGSVDFLHEANAISAHGWVNDRDFAILGRLLSNYGLLATARHVVNGSKPLDSNILTTVQMDEESFVTQKGYKGIQGDAPEVRKTSMRLDWKVAKKQRAYTNLTTDIGLTNIDALPLNNDRAFNLGYSFFVRPTAPDLKFTDRFNHEYTIPLTVEARSSHLKCYKPYELRVAWIKEGK